MAIYRPNSNELQERNTFAGVRLALAADVFVFLAFLFAYVYLRSLDSNNSWNLPGVDPSAALGGATVAALAVAAAASVVCGRQTRAGTGAVAPAAIAFAATAVAAILQGIQTFNPGFSPTYGGGYGSVMLGFTCCMFVHLLGASYWSETILATLWRSGADGETAAGAEAYGVVSVFLTIVMAVAFVLLYLIPK
jgi:heme/copper-type cytochrome/quinol oxidase subunit 3